MRAAKKKSAAPKAAPAAKRKPPAKIAGAAGVDALMAGLKHPLKAELESVRAMILAADGKIGEGVKWNAPSFRVGETYFATLHLRATDGVGVVLHRDAKARPGAVKVDDPRALLTWLGKDRAMAHLGAGRAIGASRAAFQAIVRAWIKQL